MLFLGSNGKTLCSTNHKLQECKNSTITKLQGYTASSSNKRQMAACISPVTVEQKWTYLGEQIDLLID